MQTLRTAKFVQVKDKAVGPDSVFRSGWENVTQNYWGVGVGGGVVGRKFFGICLVLVISRFHILGFRH
jgi:hypothetical protein